MLHFRERYLPASFAGRFNVRGDDDCTYAGAVWALVEAVLREKKWSSLKEPVAPTSAAPEP